MDYFRVGKLHATNDNFSPPDNEGDRFEYEEGYWEGESEKGSIVPANKQEHTKKDNLN